MTDDKLETFRSHLDLYSADLSRWPEDKMKQALSLMQKNVKARDMLAREEALDRILRAWDVDTAADARLEDRIMQQVASMSASMVTLKPRHLFAPLGGLAAAVIIGFLIGMNPSPQADSLIYTIYAEEEAIIAGDTDILDGGVF